MERKKNNLQFATLKYRIEINLSEKYCTIFSVESGRILFGFAVDSAVDGLEQEDLSEEFLLSLFSPSDVVTTIVFDVRSNLWKKKQIIFELYEQNILYFVRVEGESVRVLDLNYLLTRNGKASSTQFEQVYAPRFDWQKSQVIFSSGQSDSLSCQQWLSPPPFVYAFLSEQESVYCGVAARPGENNFLSFDYLGSEGPCFRLTYEGHTQVNGEFESPKLVIGFGYTDKNEAVNGYITWLRSNGYLTQEEERIVPGWWREPIFCGWGQMRYDYRCDHDGHENGNFVNVTDYCTEYLYRSYLKTMEEKAINPGTIIIDMGWAEQPALHTPDPKKWTDMKGFIAEQHAMGRHVLLWYTPVVTDGLPLEVCMTLDGRAVCPDPTSPEYARILAEEIRRMISDEPDCLNADGFKIDFTQNTPSERGLFIGYINSFWGLINENNHKHLYKPLGERTNLIKTHGNKWGVEILKEYIRLIYVNMKKAKSDAVLITHTSNPYFSEVVDILRLNDLDGSCENVLGVMQNRATIAKMCCKDWLLDTDNDLMYNRDRWRAYIRLQPQLGIPDTYYVSAIANSLESFEESDYTLLRQVWNDYREQRKQAQPQ